MMEFDDKYFEGLVQSLSDLEEVEAIALGGSRAKGKYDASSDYDLYVYLKDNVDPGIREKILSQFCSYMEINNQFWEMEDDCTLKNGTDIDIIYRSLPDIQNQVLAVKDGLAYNGYTTCLWDNLLHSNILHDKTGRLTDLQKQLDVPYPEELQRNIVSKNMRLLTGNLPSYDRQIKKAVQRNDLPSVCHRTTAFLESYFDILFAMNKMLHPGEKRMMEKLEGAEILPEGFKENLEALFENEYTNPDKFLEVLDAMILNIQDLAQKQGFSGN